ncbi:MAG: hypothetical protein ACFFCZ_29425 [Promethearchaeota archaeon]
MTIKHNQIAILELGLNSSLILVYYNGTNIDIREWLMERGVPKKMVIPAHLPPDEMKYIEQEIEKRLTFSFS